jgi:plasmid stabilization system protein ParE
MAIVKWSDHALDRMREQTRFIAEQSCSSEVAWNWANDIFAEAEGLANFPDMGHRLPEFPDAPYLEILVRKNFRLIYRHINDICYIVTVRRCSMLLDETSLAEFDGVQESLSKRVLNELKRVDELCETGNRHFTREESLNILRERANARRK